MITPRSLLAEIPGKRELLARGLRFTGGLRLLERTATRWPALAVFTYHRVLEPAANPFYDPVVSATPDTLGARMDWIKKRFLLPTLNQVVDQIESGRPWPAPAALVTFDDGTRDNFELAAPILAEHGIPAVFFIPTLFLESPRLPWWDKLAYLTKQTRAKRFTVSLADGRTLVLDLEIMTRDQAIQALVQAILAKWITGLDAFFADLTAQARVTLDDERLGRELFMSWDQARELVRGPAGFTIGSHGHSHPWLAELSASDQRRELADSRRILEQRLDRGVITVAYPHGGPDAYTEETKTIAAEVGYRAAFTAIEGVNVQGAADRFALKRFNCGLSDSVTLLRTRVALRAVLESLGSSAPCKNPGLRPGL